MTKMKMKRNYQCDMLKSKEAFILEIVQRVSFLDDDDVLNPDSETTISVITRFCRLER